MWAHDFCLPFQTFITHTFLYHYAMAMQFAAYIKHLIGVMVQVTEWQYFLPGLRYDLLCDGV